MKDEKTIDHQIRRCYLEIVILQILFDDVNAIESTLAQFIQDSPTAFSQEEYPIAQNLYKAVQNQDYEEITKICRQPIFSFLETEIVKMLKRYAANPPQQTVQRSL